jgi:hypothetical protein
MRCVSVGLTPPTGCDARRSDDQVDKRLGCVAQRQQVLALGVRPATWVVMPAVERHKRLLRAFFLTLTRNGGEAEMQYWRPPQFTRQFNTRLTPEMVAWLKAQAAQERLSPGAYVRKILEAHARRELSRAEDHDDAA